MLHVDSLVLVKKSVKLEVNKLIGILAVVVIALLSSCKDGMQRLPSSSARPYEVLLVGDEKDSLRDILSADAKGLPQPEPLFDVSSVKKNSLDDIKRMARAIVVYDDNNGRISIKKDLYAQPQIVIYASPKDSDEIISQLQMFEMKNHIRLMKKKHNATAEEYIRKQFGIDIIIPADMTSSKKAQNFFWISNNAATGMKNIVVMKGNAESLLKKNLKGETDSMFVELLPDGLWQMKNDAMGGPYRIVTIPATKTADKKDVTCLAFVYAPETRKRNIVRQMEAVLNTIKLYNYGRK